MFPGININAGLVALAIFGLGALLVGVTINQVIAWDATWDAWLAAQVLPAGARDALEYLPGGIVLAQILVVLALGFPYAIEINR